MIRSMSDALNILLTEKIREEQSGVYGINASYNTNKFPYENYTFSISFPCKPENSDSLSNSVFDVIKDIQVNGVSDDVTNKVIEAQKRDMEVKIKQNGYWMGALKYSYQYGYEPKEIINYQQRIDLVTKEKIQNVAMKYADFDNYVYLRLLPEN